MKKTTFMLTALSCFAVSAQSDQVALIKEHQSILMQEQQGNMKETYSGELPLSDVLVDIFNNKHQDTTIQQIDINLQMVRDSEIIVEDQKAVNSMPVDLSIKPGFRKDITVSIPYVFEEYAADNKSYTPTDFAFSVNDSISQYKAIESHEKSGTSTCGGLNVGSTFSYTENGSCGRYKYSYECQMEGSTAMWVYTGFSYELFHHCQIP